MAEITSPLPGVFYTKPGPDKDPFVSPGERVEIGDPIGIIEVMKQFTEIKSEVSGVVTAIALEDGAMVMPGELLVTVDENK